MRRDLCFVEPLRWRDVKDWEGRSEQFWTKHARDVDGFDGSHDADDANEKDRERERVIDLRDRFLPPPYIPVLELSIFLWNLIIIGARVRAACADGVMIVRLRRKQLWERRVGDELG